MNSEFMKSPGCVREDCFDKDNISDYYELSGDYILDIIKDRYNDQSSYEF